MLLDPCLLGCSDAVYEPATFARVEVPTLCLMTQTLMFTQNAAAIQHALHAIGSGDPADPAACKKRTVAWVEAAGTSHQEASDFAAIAYPTIRLSCMAGSLPPRLSLGRHLTATVGFLALVGAQPINGSAQQQQARALAASLVGRPVEDDSGDGSEQKACHDGGCFDKSAFLRHGCA